METKELKNNPAYQAGLRKGTQRGAIAAAIGVIFGMVAYDIAAESARGTQVTEPAAKHDTPRALKP